MQVAQKVGAADDLPEGVLFVDAPLPTEPRKRPLLLVSVAALALATILLVVSLVPQPRPHGVAVRPAGNGGDKGTTKDNTQGSGAKTTPIVAVPKTPSNEVGSEDELLRLLAEASGQTVQVVVTKSFDVSHPGILFQGDGKRTSLIMKGVDDEDTGKAPLLTFKYQPRDAAEPAALLQVDGADVTFENLRFRVEAGETPEAPVAAVAVRGGKAWFVRCEFAQKDVPPPPYINQRGKRTPLASVLVDSGLTASGLTASGGLAKGDRPRVDFVQCYFKSGQAAIAIHGPADVVASDCAFKPHGALFHLSGQGSANVKLHHCSAFVVSGPAFRIDDDIVCQLSAEYSIFSCTDNTVSNRDEPHLVRHTDAKEPRLVFKGLRNYYDNLNALWVWPSETGYQILANYDDFQKGITAAGGADQNSTSSSDPSIRIWKNAAPHKLAKEQEAFQLNDELREVRTLDLKRPLGVEKSAWGPMPVLEPLKDEPRLADFKLKDNEKVVNPTSDGTTVGVYKSLSLALYAANPGDVILLKHGKSRELDLEMTHLKKPKIDITLKPYEGYQPILTLPFTRDVHPCFLSLHDGRMLFEQLEILLDPDQKLFQSQSFVQIDGPAAVTFRNCVITLRQNAKINQSKAVPLSIVSVGESDEAMMMMGTRPMRSGAEIAFHNCFLRGEGEVVSNRAGRPMDLSTDNTLVGLQGSLLALQGAAKEMPLDAAVTLRLTRSSFFLTEPLVTVRAGQACQRDAAGARRSGPRLPVCAARPEAADRPRAARPVGRDGAFRLRLARGE